MKYFFTLCFFLLLFFSPRTGFAQSKIPNDLWMWQTVSVEKKLPKNFSVVVEEELRLFDNITRINLFFTNGGIVYRYGKHFKFSLVYRYIQKSRDGMDYSDRHRLYFDAAYKKKYFNWTLSYRLRLQGQVRDYYSSDHGKSIESYMRHKFDLSYTYKKYTPYIAEEVRMQFTNPGFEQADYLWDRSRSYIGCDYDINKKQTFGLYYMIQHDFNNQRQENDFTIGVDYAYSF